jgi:hypothetical protein
LIGTGDLQPAGRIREKIPAIPYADDRRKGAWRFDDLVFSYPARVLRPAEAARRGMLTDPDLYLQGIDLPDLHPGIQLALGEAIRCFRCDFFLGAATMLAAAADSIWMELARCLMTASDASARPRKIKKALESPARAADYLVRQVVGCCESLDESTGVLAQAGVTAAGLRSATQWWHSVRDAANILEWGSRPDEVSGFDSVSVLILSAASHIRTLWAIRSALTAWEPQPSVSQPPQTPWEASGEPLPHPSGNGEVAPSEA